MTGKTSSTASIKINNSFTIRPGQFFFIGGPCMLENEKMAFKIASELKTICMDLNIPFIFKASYDKANRTSVKSFRGPGALKGLKALARIKKALNVPVLTDVHSPAEAKLAAKYVDMLQIPAFLSRQTDLLLAAAKTGKAVNIKKGQFLSPAEMENTAEKVSSAGNKNIMLTERGFSFGYNNLVVDMKSIAQMKKYGYPVIIDATHAVQRPGGAGTSSAGEREFVEAIAKAAVAAGADGVFMEVHHDVKNAKSDKDTQLPLEKAAAILKKLKKIHSAVNS